MKTLFFIAFALHIVCGVYSQSIGKLSGQKDVWGLTYSYAGELKNGKADGMGVASYETGNVVRYVGHFTNGMYEGKGTMFFKDSAFLTGNWKNGKLNGKGANLTSNGSLYIGDFGNGVKNGNGVLIYKDNSVVKGSFLDDKMHGRCLKIWTDGTIVSDAIYANDKLNGTGYQYEAKVKKLYAGEWKDDKWVQAIQPSFSSFLNAAGFIGEYASDHVLMGTVNSSKLLKDTAYYYDLNKKKRHFGYYENGHIRNGIIIRDDSTRFIGSLDAKGATGYCYDFRFGKYYSEGFYANDYLHGKILDIDIAKKSVYMGEAVNGKFTGKGAYFFSGSGTMYKGDYLEGKFTGAGTRVQTNGKIVSGVWRDGQLTTLGSITTSQGDVIAGAPKTFAEGINMLAKTFADFYDDFIGDVALDFDYSDDPDEDNRELAEYNESILNLPGSIEKNVIATDYDLTNYWYAKYLETPTWDKAVAKYKELATQIKAVVLSAKELPANSNLNGELKLPKAAGETVESEFMIPKATGDFEYFRVWLNLHQNESNNYVVSISIGEKG